MATKFTYLNPDPAPVTQQGVCTEYPAGYGGTPVHWVGPLSQIVAAGSSGVKVKIPQGFQPKRFVMKAEALAAPVITDGKPVSGFPTTLVPGDSVPLAIYDSGGNPWGSGTLTSGAPVAAGELDISGDPVPVVTNDSTYVKVAEFGTATLSGDAMAEVLVYCDIVDPHPPKMF